MSPLITTGKPVVTVAFAACLLIWLTPDWAAAQPAADTQTAAAGGVSAISISVDDIRVAMQSRRLDVRECVFSMYDGPATQITLDVQMTIGADGMVEQATMFASESSTTVIDRCVVEVVEGVVFPPPGRAMRIRYQYLFLVGPT
jgi:hypothetical protein